MSSSAIGGDTLGRVGGEASPSVSPSMEGVLPIRGVYGSTGKAIPIDAAPFRVDVVRWSALDVPSIMVEEDLTKLSETYRIPAAIELILPGPNERACFSRRGCTALHLNAFVSGMRLPLHPMLQRILRAYDLAPTQVTPNGWSQMVGGMYLWFRHSFGMEMALHVFQTIYQLRKLQKKKGREEEAGWYYFCPWGSHKPLVTSCPSSIKQWKESWFWVSGNWQRVFEDPKPDLDVPSVYGITNSLPRCELSRDIVDVLRSIYQADPKTRSYELILNRHRCLVELGLMASKGKHPRPTLARLTKQRPKVLALGSAEDTSQRKVIEDLSREENIEAVGASTVIEVDNALEEEVPMSRKKKARASGTETSQVMENVVEVVDNYTVCSAPPFRGRWLSIRRERWSSKEQRKLIAEALKSDKEHKQALEGLQTALDSTWTAYEQMEADLKESDSNVLNLTKKLNNANAAQKVTTEALEATNGKKRCLLEEAKFRDEEIQSLRRDLESSENGRKEAEAGRKEVEAKLANAEADFVANFHNTEAYTNFYDYFARVSQQEVLTALRKDHPNFDLGSLEARFPPPDMEGKEGN
ncbi:Plus3 domain-containing protein [Abeliophyllum distichum]|uniref:Plus3 domain-containing protein n=1 Tax=Abeliophyllum distichum TaxID=126358 RepID=A0ABD1NUP7_9LAMI